MPIEFQSSTADVPEVKPLIYRFRMSDDEFAQLQKDLGATFDTLPLDPYNLSGNKYWTHAKMQIRFGANDPNSINVQRIKPAGPFVQPGRPDRHIADTLDIVTDNPSVLNLIKDIARMVKFVRSDAQGLLMDVHQMRYVARKEAPYVLADGRHSDGVNYILSAFVMRREGVRGGESIVYGEDGEILLRLILDKGEGIVEDDERTTHEFTTMMAENDIGIRDIFGFDLKVQTDPIFD